MKKIIFILLFVPELLMAQNCNCHSDYLWLKSFFEKNDAGFQISIDKKGMGNYQLFSDSIERKSLQINNVYECEKLLDNWTKFFRKGHVGIELINDKLSLDTIIFNRSKVSYTVKDINNNLKNNYGDTNLQGIWLSEAYTIGIIKDSTSSLQKYIGFVIKSRYSEWKEGMLKLEIIENKSGKLTCNYFKFNHSLSKFSVKQINKNQIDIGNGFLTLYKKDIFKNKIDSLDISLLHKTLPYFVVLSDKTTLLRLPSFAYYQKRFIDIILKENKKQIISHQNLIIDLRNNGGGTDVAFDNIIPLLYTNSIVNYNIEFLSTPENNNYLYENNDSFIAKLIVKKYVKKLNNHLGEFVNILGEDSLIRKQKKIYEKPENVYILINENCASSAEQFLLAAKQSLKVKLIGKNTYGALDVSNVKEKISPDSLFTLYYSVSKTLRPPYQHIDGKGIEPDIKLNNSVNDYEWLKYTLNIIKDAAIKQ